MNKTVIALIILTVIWVAFVLACIFSLHRAVESTCDWCFANDGKWYTSTIAE